MIDDSWQHPGNAYESNNIQAFLSMLRVKGLRMEAKSGFLVKSPIQTWSRELEADHISLVGTGIKSIDFLKKLDTTAWLWLLL
jgi:hypothetical protein